MQTITKNNYEAYLLDFCEGNLSDELCVELELFVITNPDLGIDLSTLSFETVDVDNVMYNEKESLKKRESQLIADTQFVAYIENQLSDNEKVELEKSCSNNLGLAKELSYYKNTVTIPDVSVVYQNKEALKHKPKVLWFDFSATQYSIAASILLLLGLFAFWPTTETPNDIKQIAQTIDTTKSHKHEKNEFEIIAPKQQLANATHELKQAPNYLYNKINKKKTVKQIAVNNTNNNTKIKPQIIEDLKPIDNQTKQPENGLNVAMNELQVKETIPHKSAIIETIIESDDDNDLLASESKTKKGFWALATNVLKNANTLGAKKVNGNENKESYDLSLGRLTIQHKSATKL